jgi:membrane protease YdiL (CAAX protease family)
MTIFPRPVPSRALVRAWVAFLLAVLLPVGVIVAVGLSGGHLPDSIVPCLVLIGSAAGAASLWRVLRGWSITDLGLQNPGRRGLHLLWQVPAALAVALTVTAIVGQVVGLGPAASTASRESAGTPAAAVTLLACYLVLGPVVEEILVRRMTMPWVESLLARTIRSPRGAAVGAVLLSSLVFAALHVVAPVMLWAFFLGVGCAVLTRVHRSLWGGLALHITVNVIAGAALFPALAG